MGVSVPPNKSAAQLFRHNLFCWIGVATVTGALLITGT